MPIDFSKYIQKSTPAPAKNSGGIDFSKYITAKQPVAKPADNGTKEATLPDFLGGGSYTSVKGQPNKLVTTERGYDTMKSKPDTERDHVVPVSLGGVSKNKNLKYTPMDSASKTDMVETQAVRDYKAGKISLPEARLRVLTAKQKADDEAKGISQSTAKNFLPAVKENAGKVASKVGGFFNDLGKSIVQPFAEVGAGVVNAGKNIKELAVGERDENGKIKDHSTDTYNLPWLGETKPFATGNEGGVEMGKKIVGYGADIASNLVGGGAIKSVGKEVLKTTLKDGLKQVAKDILIKGAKPGAIVGAMMGGGKALEQNKGMKDVAKETAIGAGAGAVIGGALEGVAKGAVALRAKSAEVGDLAFKGKKTPAVVQKSQEAAKFANPADPNVTYAPKKSLGVDGSGKKVLAKTEINHKTGQATIYYDRNLVKNQKAFDAVMDHEHGHLIDKKLAGGTNLSSQIHNYDGNQSALDATLKDFAETKGKTTQQVSQEISTQLDKLAKGENRAEQFAEAFRKYKANPAMAKKVAPTFVEMIEHKAEPGIERTVTTAETIAKTKTTEKTEALKARMPEEPKESLIHYTKPENIENIKNSGLMGDKTQTGIRGEGVYFYPKESPTQKFPTSDVPLRINPEAVAKYDVAHYGGVASEAEREAVIKGNVSPDDLQYFKDGKWTSLKEDATKVAADEMALRQEAHAAGLVEHAKVTTPLENMKAHNEKLPAELQFRNPREVKEFNRQLENMPFSGTGFKTGNGVSTKSFNPKTINAPEDVQQLFEGLGGKNNFKSQRISKGNEDIKDLARMTGLTEDQLIEAKPGSIANAETVTKARQLVIDKAQDLMNTLREINVDRATDDELRMIKDKWVKLVSMQKAVAGFRTEASNVFRSLGIELMPGENATLAELGSMLHKADIASGGDAALFSKKIADEMKLTGLQKTGKFGLSAWYAAILSGYKTTVRNIVSTSSNIVTDLFSKLGNPKTMKEFLPAAKGLLQGIKEGAPDAWKVLKGEMTNADEKFLDSHGGQVIKETAFKGKLGKVERALEIVGRFLNAQDTLMVSGAAGMEKNALKVYNPEISAKVSEAISKAYGEVSAYHGEAKGTIIHAITKGAQETRRLAPITKVIMPFVNTVANVMDRPFDYVPIFSYLRLGDKIISRQAEKIAKDYGLKEADVVLLKRRLYDQQVGRAVLGTVVSGYAMTAAMDGKISGNGPKDFNLKKQMIQEGWRPNSVQIGDTWYPYLNWGPIAGILSMAGNIHDKKVYDKNAKTIGTTIANGLVGWMQTNMQQSFLNGTSAIFDVLNGNTTPEDYFKNMIAGFVNPAIVTQITKPLEQYDAKTIGERIKLSFGYTGGLQPKLDVFGNQLKSDRITGLSPSKMKNDPVLQMLNKDMITISMPNKNTAYKVPNTENDKRALNPGEYTQFVQQSGSQIYAELQNRIDELNDMEPDARNTEVNKIVTTIRKEVRDNILSQ